MQLHKPVPPDCVVTVRFGPYPQPIALFTGRDQHYGIDFALPHALPDRSIPITPAANGIYLGASYNNDAGNYCMIAHKTQQNFIITIYAHLTRTFLPPLTPVLTNTIIGHMGDTGKVTAKHLHFGMAILTMSQLVLVDPAPFFIN